jgi:hypothetical protein
MTAAATKLRADDIRNSSVDDDLKAKVETLVEQLDSATRKRRALAERELKTLGPAVLPFLPPPKLLPTVAVREAVRRIRRGLERAKALESIRPSQVTLKGRFRLVEIVAAVTAQTGNPVELTGLSAGTMRKLFDVDYTKLTFWQVLDDLVSRADLAYDTGADADRVALVMRLGGVPRELAVTYSGPIRIAVDRAGLRRFPKSGPIRIVRLNFRLNAEPRLRPLFVKYRGSDFAAQTPGGEVLAPFSPDAHPEIPLGEGGRQLQLHSDFRARASSVPDKIDFRGKLTMTVAAGTEQIRFTRLDQAEGTARRRGGVTVKLQKIEFGKNRKGRAQARLRVIVSYDSGGPAFESHRTWIFHNQVYLETEGGRRIERDGVFHTALQTDGAVVVEYGFSGLTRRLDEYRFVYVAPTLIVNMPIEFDMPRIPVSTTAIKGKQP